MHKMKKEIIEQPIVLKQSYEHNIDKIELIAKNILDREIDNIIFVARGSSDNAAIYGKYLIEILSGIPVGLAAPSVASIYKKNLKLDNTCVIGVSQSGQSEDICNFVEMTNKSGAMTAAITNTPNSRLANCAQYTIDMNVGVEEAVAATKTFTAEILLLELLAAFLGKRDDIINELSMIDEIIKKTLELEEKIKNEVVKFRYVSECFILGRGIVYPLALEFALKIQETSYVRAKGFSTSDFMHGPIAMIERNIPVFILALNDETIEDSIRIVNKLTEEKIDVIAFSDIDEVKEKSFIYFAIDKELGKFIKPLFMVPVIQMFSYYLCVAKGYDPDTPRLLRKVTITK